MTNRPAVVEMSCIAGVDGYNLDETFGDYKADNTDCDDFFSSTTLRTANLMEVGSRRTKIQSGSVIRFDILANFLWIALAVMTLLGLWSVCRTGRVLIGHHTKRCPVRMRMHHFCTQIEWHFCLDCYAVIPLTDLCIIYHCIVEGGDPLQLSNVTVEFVQFVYFHFTNILISYFLFLLVFRVLSR